MLPKDKAERKRHPIWMGVIMYFPRTIVWLAKCSWIGNEQHNPGEPLHWSREKSNDHEDCLLRHMLEGESLDDDGVPHCVKVVWRACARAELMLEKMDKASGNPTRLVERYKVVWMGEKIGYGIGNQILITCPHCKQAVAQARHMSSCVKCGGDFMEGMNRAENL